MRGAGGLRPGGRGRRFSARRNGRGGGGENKADDFLRELGMTVVEREDVAGVGLFVELGAGGLGGVEKLFGRGGIHNFVGGGNGHE